MGAGLHTGCHLVPPPSPRGCPALELDHRQPGAAQGRSLEDGPRDASGSKALWLLWLGYRMWATRALGEV